MDYFKKKWVTIKLLTCWWIIDQKNIHPFIINDLRLLIQQSYYYYIIVII